MIGWWLLAMVYVAGYAYWFGYMQGRHPQDELSGRILGCAIWPIAVVQGIIEGISRE